MSKQDPQQDRAYKWEDSFTLWAGSHLTESEARTLITQACRKYRVPVPTIQFPSKNWRAGRRMASTYHPDSHLIKIRPRHLSAPIVLHEAAHAITDWILGLDLAAHGPEWLGVYMVLLEDARISTVHALHASADAAKLDYRPRHLVGPATIRKRYKKKRRRARQEQRLGYWT